MLLLWTKTIESDLFRKTIAMNIEVNIYLVDCSLNSRNKLLDICLVKLEITAYFVFRENCCHRFLEWNILWTKEFSSNFVKNINFLAMLNTQ